MLNRLFFVDFLKQTYSAKVCFFCNNQYRILEAKTQTGSDELKTVFESHLASAGRMLLLLDSFVDPAYIK